MEALIVSKCFVKDKVEFGLLFSRPFQKQNILATTRFNEKTVLIPFQKLLLKGKNEWFNGIALKKQKTFLKTTFCYHPSSQNIKNTFLIPDY